MAAYNSVSKRIKNALVTILQGIQYDTGSGPEPAFVSVIGSTKDEFDSYPLLRVLPAHVDDQKAATGQNDKTIHFMLLGHLQIEDVTTVPADVFDHMYDLTDLIIDTLDTADFTDQLRTVDATLPTFLMDVTQGDWTTEPTSAGAQLTWVINLQISYAQNN